MTQLDFIEETHTYLLNGVTVPSVTQCTEMLNDYSSVPEEVLRAAGDFGRNVHLATELWDSDDLDEDGLDPNLIPWLSGWKKFISESGFKIIEKEQRVFSVKYRYAGTLDRYGVMNGKKIILDIKTPSTIPVSAGPQTAGYQQAKQEMTGEKIAGRYVVQLNNKGTYKLIPYKDNNDFNIFISCLNVINYRRKT